MKKMSVIMLWGMAFSGFALDMQVKISPEQIDNLAIKVGSMQASEQVPQFTAPARVVVPSDRELLISAPQPGFLTQLQANIGDKVSKGQVVAQINSPELVVLQQNYLNARNDMNLVSLEQRRDRKLLDEGVIAERRMQQTQAMYNSKAVVADEAKQLLGMAGMTGAEIDKLNNSHKLSSLLAVRSPISGIVLERMVTVGERLDMQSPLYRVADLSELWLEINIPQEKIQNLRIGDLVKIENTGLSAKITLLGQNVNRQNQTVMARAVILGQAEQLRVGQNLNVQLMQDTGAPSFKVPDTAIAQNAGSNFVFLRNGEGFSVIPVQVLGRQDKTALIAGPLNGNEQIATQGAVALKATWLGLGGDD